MRVKGGRGRVSQRVHFNAVVIKLIRVEPTIWNCASLSYHGELVSDEDRPVRLPLNDQIGHGPKHFETLRRNESSCAAFHHLLRVLRLKKQGSRSPTRSTYKKHKSRHEER